MRIWCLPFAVNASLNLSNATVQTSSDLSFHSIPAFIYIVVLCIFLKAILKALFCLYYIYCIF